MLLKHSEPALEGDVAGSSVEIDTGRVDRKRCMDLLESEGRMGRILSPELVGAPDLSTPFEGRPGLKPPELISRN